MSRYSLKPLSQHSEVFEVAVGWDGGLDTYFIMAFGVPEASREPAILLWRGTSLRDITSTDVLLAIARTFAEIPNDLAAKLHFDRLAAPHNLEAPISRLLAELLARPSPTQHYTDVAFTPQRRGPD